MVSNASQCVYLRLPTAGAIAQTQCPLRLPENDLRAGVTEGPASHSAFAPLEDDLSANAIRPLVPEIHLAARITARTVGSAQRAHAPAHVPTWPRLKFARAHPVLRTYFARAATAALYSTHTAFRKCFCSVCRIPRSQQCVRAANHGRSILGEHAFISESLKRAMAAGRCNKFGKRHTIEGTDALLIAVELESR